LRPAHRSAYHAALVADPARSPVSRYRRLGEDVAADRALIAPFVLVASRVIEADRLRLRAVPFTGEATGAGVGAAVARVAENRCVVAWVPLADGGCIGAEARLASGEEARPSRRPAITK
jgi:hypothetical protein